MRAPVKRQVLLASANKKSLHAAVDLKQVSMLSDNHVEYCLELKKTINPDSKDFSLVYGASGPDLSVPLLTTDANEILCLDNHKLDLNKFQTILDKGLTALYDTRQLPLDLHSGLGHSPDRPQEFLEEALENRTRQGYWLASHINTLGFERCIAVELDKLGVDLNKVEIGKEGKRLFIEFPWAFPGASAKQRKISFQVAKLPGALNDVDFSKHQGYLQKSGMNSQNKKPMREAMQAILKTAPSDFFVIAGRPLERREQARASDAKSYFGLEIANQMVDLAVDVPKYSYGSYGQQMLLTQVI